MTLETQPTTDTTTGAVTVPAIPQAPTTTTPAPVAQPPASPAPGLYAPDGKTWQSKFHGAEGRAQQVTQQRDTVVGGYEQRISDLQQELREAQAKVTTLEGQVQKLTGQVDAIPQLRGELDAAKSAAAKASRLQVLMRHPGLLSVQVEEEREVEGQTQTVQVNPFMQFVDSTTLEGDPLDAMLRQMASAMSVPAVIPAPAPVVEGAAPQPATPAGESGADALRKEALGWHRLKINGEVGPNGEDPAAEEQKAWSAFYEAQGAATT